MKLIFLLLTLGPLHLMEARQTVDDARRAIISAHCELTSESPKGHLVLTRPILRCPLDDRKATATIGAPGSLNQQYIAVSACNLNGTTVEIDITLSSRVESAKAHGKSSIRTHGTRIQDTVELGSPIDVKLTNPADLGTCLTLVVTFRQSDEH